MIEFFSPQSIGGPNLSSQAPRLLELYSGLGQPVITDIAGDKKIFRKRAWVGEFFKAHKLKAGDQVIIERTDTDRYHIYPNRTP